MKIRYCIIFISFFTFIYVAGLFGIFSNFPKINRIDLHGAGITDKIVEIHDNPPIYDLKNTMREQIKIDLNLKTRLYNAKRLMCIEKIRIELKTAFSSMISYDDNVHFFGVPHHQNHGDTLILMGEYILFNDIGYGLSNRSSFCSSKQCISNTIFKNIYQNDTIVFQGGGNFGDLWYSDQRFRITIMNRFKRNKFILMPQSVYYVDYVVAAKDSNFYTNLTTITVRSRSSYEFSKRFFPQSKVFLLPDIAFMIGDMKTKVEPKYDVIIIKRSDKESLFKEINWKSAYRLLNQSKFSYFVTDWFKNGYSYPDKPDFIGRARNVTLLVANLISLGKVLITDRLHASILGILVNKPHVILDNSYKKISSARETAFNGKNECHSFFLRASFQYNPYDTVKEAIRILNNNLFVD